VLGGNPSSSILRLLLFLLLRLLLASICSARLDRSNWCGSSSYASTVNNFKLVNSLRWLTNQWINSLKTVKIPVATRVSDYVVNARSYRGLAPYLPIRIGITPPCRLLIPVLFGTQEASSHVGHLLFRCRYFEMILSTAHMERCSRSSLHENCSSVSAGSILCWGHFQCETSYARGNSIWKAVGLMV